MRPRRRVDHFARHSVLRVGFGSGTTLPFESNPLVESSCPPRADHRATLLVLMVEKKGQNVFLLPPQYDAVHNRQP